MATKTDTPQLSGIQLYSRFAFAGAVCCSVTHGALTPVDVYVLPSPRARNASPLRPLSSPSPARRLLASGAIDG